jgi:hypothetical protein
MLGSILALLMLGTATYGQATTASLTLTGTGPGYEDGSGIYVYPYVFTVNGVGGVSLVCDDYGDTVNIGESWTANVYNINQVLNSGDGQMTVASGAIASSRNQAYIDAAWLYTQLMLPANNNDTNAAAINNTIWALFSNTTLGTDGTAGFTVPTGAGSWYAQAQAATTAGGFNALTAFSNLVFYTPVAGSQPSGDGRPQEYIGTTVPEPGSLALLGVGLVGFGMVSRKRRFQA